MSDNSSLFQVGEIVEILMGRDTGKYAVVLEIINDRYVIIADGDKRKFDHPKKKNVRHLRTTGYISEEVVKSIMEDKRVSNAKLRYVLQNYISNNFNEDEKKGE
ncbi:hypothetical protein BHF71_04615 [Vulcanibacillus modesticaldus]|uniref:KOW domain-containing protein n=1 Tax=Vulcanibacillus modesticaldus TaxID=337097 RepID=A0A1D2YS42_9BACI|nr:KOW domain-containing RNA-binding protein [Vulcanibacillus modesticaldus]OEF96440.1 hypothetical protein BHF71_04615 [Vulcanibacillus modesticaldus]